MNDLVARLREWMLIDDDLGSRDLRLWREAADEIERLRALGATLLEQHKQAHENSTKIFSALVDISALTPLGGEVADYADVVAAVRALRDDAERYRWLRGEVHGPHIPLAQVVWKSRNIRDSGEWTNLADGPSLDAAIDAARKAPPKPK